MADRRIPKETIPPLQVNQVLEGDALSLMKDLPDDSIAAAITSPPYWDMIDYEMEGQIGPSSYDEYLHALLEVWQETKRVLIPNGKLAIVTPVMPIRKDVIGDQHTRHLKNIGSDIEASVLGNVKGLERFSLFIWQKQTTTKMFGSYPYPPNIYEDNTVEFIHVFVKEGAPPPVAKEVKEHSRITQDEWRNLTMQVWPMYPADVKRAGGHPAPFPTVLPQRLIMMYTFRGVPELDFAGDVVLDMFNGSGSTCVAARTTGRNWLGFDLNPEYCQTARNRIAWEEVNPSAVMLESQRVRKPRDSRNVQTALFEEPEPDPEPGEDELPLG